MICQKCKTKQTGIFCGNCGEKFRERGAIGRSGIRVTEPGEYSIFADEQPLLALVTDFFIDPTDGKDTIVSSERKGIFSTGLFEYVNRNFRKWGLDTRGLATKRQSLLVFRALPNVTLGGAVDAIALHIKTDDMKKLCLEQSQILAIIGKRRKSFRIGGYKALFLLEKSSRFYVVSVSATEGVFWRALEVNVEKYGKEKGTSYGYPVQIIVPGETDLFHLHKKEGTAFKDAPPAKTVGDAIGCVLGCCFATFFVGSLIWSLFEEAGFLAGVAILVMILGTVFVRNW